MNGDPEAFGELFRRHRGRLWAVALRTLHHPDDAADALQEAMISAFRRAGDFRGEAAVTTWLHRIVVNACLDQLRRRAARPAIPADDEEALDALGQRLAGPAPDPAAASDAALDVSAALQLLPAGQRAALVLVDMLGYPVDTAAEVLGVSPGTVKSRCARGRARLLPHLAHLRESARSAAGPRNQTAGGSVSPSPGTQAAPGAHGPRPEAGQGPGERGGPERRGMAAAPATSQQPRREESTGHDRPL